MKKLILTGVMLVGSLSMFGSPLTPEQAMSRAMGSSPLRLRVERAHMQLVDTRMQAERNTIYLFATDNSFVITPADDLLPAVLGYGYNSVKTEAGEMPENFSYWLDFLSRRAIQAVNQGGVPNFVRPDRPIIEKLCATEWNQSSPYNNMCPTLSGSRCPTGCVATSMSQAVKYHNWPPQGVGTSSYYWQNGGQTLSYNYASMNFDWDNMLNQYGYNATSTQQNAVALLMKAMGGSVEMIYGQNSSGAYSAHISAALTSHFRYDKGVQYLLRDYYSLIDWENIIYSSLQNYGPVIYGGVAPVGGHSFICDGYQGGGYFHINWGWGGSSDGFFLLDMLDPQNQGIGGASGYAFNDSQDAVVWLRPDTIGDSQPAPSMMWGSNGYNTYTTRTFSPGSSFGLSGGDNNNGFWNYGPYPIPATTKLGIMFENLYTGEYTYNGDEIGEELDIYYGFRSLSEEFPTLDDGLYKIYLALQEGDTIQPLKVKYGSNQYVIGTVTNTQGRMSYPAISIPVVSEIVFPDSCDVNELNLSVTAKLYNNGPKDWDNQAIRLELYRDNKLYGYGEEMYINGEVTDSINVNYETTVITLVQTSSNPSQTGYPGHINTSDEGDDDDESELPEEGEYKVVLAIKNGTNNTWLPLSTWQDVKLTNPANNDNPPAGIKDGITSDEMAEYYDLQGNRVENDKLTPGVYVKKVGEKSTKVIVK